MKIFDSIETSLESNYNISSEDFMGLLILFALGVVSLACIVSLLGKENQIEVEEDPFFNSEELDISQIVEYSHHHS
jgi:hypothetical protein